MKIGISGIKGFVGTNLEKRLSSDFKVFGVTRKPNRATNLYPYDDISSVMNKCGVFLHLAGKAHDLKNTANPEDYFTVNTKLTETLFEEFLASDCKIFIHFSSVKAVTDKVNGILTEDAIPDPQTVYGKSKLEAENYILGKNIPEGKKFYILRPCLMHGKNNKGNLKLLYSFVKKGLPYPLGAFSNKRSYLSIDNLEFLIRQLMIKQPESGIYNIADNTPVSTTELITTIGKSIGKKARVFHIPKICIRILAKIGTLLRLSFNTEKLDKMTENYVVSNTKIKSALAIELPFTAIEGLENTFSSMNEE